MLVRTGIGLLSRCSLVLEDAASSDGYSDASQTM
jgi:hypothetical protein